MTTIDNPTSRLDGTLSLGKRRALQALSTREQVFAILAVDHIAAMTMVARPDSPETVTDAELVALKLHLVSTISQPASGILIDPVLGLAPIVEQDALAGTTGLLIGLEDGDYASPDRPPRLFADWDVARAARSGATGVKVSFVYDPFSSTNGAHEFVSSLVDACERHELPLFAEPLVPLTKQNDRRKVVIETAHRIGDLGVDILKLEFPSNRDNDNESEWHDACAELTAASPCPWTLLSGGADLATFSRQLTIACDAGASGYVAGRAIWQDLVATDTADRIAATAEAKQRMQDLTDIAAAHATPWTTWFEGPS
ncbi:hypothetical protein MNBD_ACTINO02-2216 [hydrothermal vent metagenome]|uniref:Tagatose-bisphosphate aldolase n=1 Tax=hydrothermal vent metagenome TaxID=652676 RepID=A0A3B0RXN3_9ZZZZ